MASCGGKMHQTLLGWIWLKICWECPTTDSQPFERVWDISHFSSLFALFCFNEFG